MGYIALRRALQSENNHGSHIEGSFQIEVLKTSHFKGPHRNEGFRRVQLMNSSGPLDPLHDDGASVWPRDDDAEGHFKKQLFGPLHPLKLSLRRVNPLKGLWHSIGMSPSEWNAGPISKFGATFAHLVSRAASRSCFIKPQRLYKLPQIQNSSVLIFLYCF